MEHPGWSMRLVGPNCFAVAVPGMQLNATFATRQPKATGVVHKTDAGVVMLDLRTSAEVADAFRQLSPLTGAQEMIGGVRAVPLLTGHRGLPQSTRPGWASVLLRVSRLADDLPEVAELDLNPGIARPQDVQAVDVRIRIVPATPRDPVPAPAPVSWGRPQEGP